MDLDTKSLTGGFLDSTTDHGGGAVDRTGGKFTILLF